MFTIHLAPLPPPRHHHPHPILASLPSPHPSPSHTLSHPLPPSPSPPIFFIGGVVVITSRKGVPILPITPTSNSRRTIMPWLITCKLECRARVVNCLSIHMWIDKQLTRHRARVVNCLSIRMWVDKQLTRYSARIVNSLSFPTWGWQAVDKTHRHNCQQLVNSDVGLTSS